MAKKSELTLEQAFEVYLQLGFQSQIAFFKMVQADLAQKQELAKVQLESLNEVVKTA